MTSSLSKINIWSQVIQEQTLCDDIIKLGKIDTNTNEIKRDVESYEVNYQVNSDARKNKRRQRRNKKNKRRRVEIKDELQDGLVSFDTNKIREHIKANEWDKDEIVAGEIVRQLNERNHDLIVRCVKILGKKKCLELLYATQDIQENGGILTEDGYRQKSSGGVFLQLLKNDQTILREQKSNIFIQQKQFKKLKKKRKRLQTRMLKSQKELSTKEEKNASVKDNDCIEEGEIL